MLGYVNLDEMIHLMYLFTVKFCNPLDGGHDPSQGHKKEIICSAWQTNNDQGQQKERPGVQLLQIRMQIENKQKDRKRTII